MTTKLIDNDTILECFYCKKPFDVEANYESLDEYHKGHIEDMFHQEGLDCITCDGDEPAHCQAYMESAIDMAMSARN